MKKWKLKEKSSNAIQQIVDKKPLTIPQQRRVWARALLLRDAALALPGQLRHLHDRLRRIEDYLDALDDPAWERIRGEEREPMPLPAALSIEDKDAWMAQENKVIKSIVKTLTDRIRETVGLDET